MPRKKKSYSEKDLTPEARHERFIVSGLVFDTTITNLQKVIDLTNKELFERVNVADALVLKEMTPHQLASFLTKLISSVTQLDKNNIDRYRIEKELFEAPPDGQQDRETTEDREYRKLHEKLLATISSRPSPMLPSG